jgi:hypothetical protein
MRRDFVPQQGEKRRQCGALASIFNEVEVQKNKHVEYKPLAIEYNAIAYRAPQQFKERTLTILCHGSWMYVRRTLILLLAYFVIFLGGPLRFGVYVRMCTGAQGHAMRSNGRWCRGF